MPTAAPAKPRRTQDERRAATRQALLDAALACLLEDGFAGLTTRRVAARAGVSAATLRFYFPTRAAFVAAAVEQLAVELLRQHREHVAQQPAPAGSRIASWLDELWEICKGPAFNVMIELSSAARNDEDARHNFALAERALTKHISLAATDAFPDQIADPRFRTLVDLATASMRGLAMFLPVADREQLEQRWDAVRAELVRLYESLPSSSGSAREAD
jgi:AcrR family transcriptional regulator